MPGKEGSWGGGRQKQDACRELRANKAMQCARDVKSKGSLEAGGSGCGAFGNL